VTAAEPASEKLIDGDYYKGSYGPTVILTALSLKGVELMHGVFARLADSKGVTVDLTEIPGVAIQSVSRLMLIQVAERPDVALRLRSHERSDNVEIEWRQNVENWRRTAALLEPFLIGRTGHQYLTEENRDAALVEFSFGESKND
jgi:hypothetical protein